MSARWSLVLSLLLLACSGTPSEPEIATGPAEPPRTSSPSAARSSPEATPSPSGTTPTSDPSPTATSATPTPEGPVETAASEVATGLEVPWALAFTPDGRTYVTERPTGRVLEIVEGQAREVHRFEVDPTGEGGLLGLAVSPGWQRDGLLYAYHSTPQDNRVVRFAPGAGDGPEVILDGIPHAAIHNGGRVAFGPDGMLYVTTGDAGEAARGQQLDSLGGKILRLTPDGDVPDDNPFDGSLVWSLGHRNVQGLAWDASGRLYATELGPNRDDEINLIRAGANYGWPEVTGRAGVEGFVDPIVVVQTDQASWSGAAILVDGAIPQWEGDLFAAALNGERLWRIDLRDDGGVAGTEELLVDEYGRLRLAEQAPDGSLWLLTSNRDGRGNSAPNDDRILRLGPRP